MNAGAIEHLYGPRIIYDVTCRVSDGDISVWSNCEDERFNLLLSDFVNAEPERLEMARAILNADDDKAAQFKLFLGGDW